MRVETGIKAWLVCGALLGAATSTAAQKWFASPRYLTDMDAESVTTLGIGDVDGDGDDDFLAVDSAHTKYLVYINQGGGDFMPLPSVALPAAPSSFSLLRGPLVDFTGDGHVDLAYRKFEGGHFLGVFPGNGDGSFGAGADSPVESNYVDHLFVDVDGDGTHELAYANDLGPAPLFDDTIVRWWNWNGTALRANPGVTISGDPPEGVNAIASVDANGDGSADIAISSQYTKQVRVLHTSGLTLVNPGLSYAVPMSQSTSAYLFAGDLDGDGPDDLVMSASLQVGAGETLFYVPLVGSPGNFAVGAQSSIPNPDQIHHWDTNLFDWDGDGDGDLVSHTFSSLVDSGLNPGLAVLENDGGHAFAARGFYRTDQDGWVGGFNDLDGDGFADVIGPRSVIFGTGRMDVQPTRAPWGAHAFNEGQHAFVDLEDDGDRDILTDDFDVLLNDGTGAFSDDFADVIHLALPGPSGVFYTDARAFADFTGDGHRDLIVTMFAIIGFGSEFAAMRLIASDGVGGWVDAGNAAPAGEHITSSADLLFPFDLDQDGDTDLLTHNGWWPNDGNGFFAALDPLWFGQVRDVVDIDGDGDFDVLTVSLDDELALQRNDGNQVFTHEVLVDRIGDTSIGGEFLDLDGDGDLDAILGEGDGPDLHAVLNDGSGQFGAPVVITGLPGQNDHIAVDDVDGDGISDLITADRQGLQNPPKDPKVVVLRRTHPTQLVYEAPRAFVGGSTRGFTDIDNDGDLDAVGGFVTLNNRFMQPDDGLIRQFGTGVAGSAGVVPIVGATGPLRVDSTTAAVRLRGGLGGGISFLLVGLSPTELPGPFLGGTLYVFPLHELRTFVLAGAPGVAGAGERTIDITPVLPALAGFSVYLQTIGLDAGALVGKSSSNALEMIFAP